MILKYGGKEVFNLTNNYNTVSAAECGCGEVRETRCDRSVCTAIVLGILAAILALTIGIIIGANFATAILGALAAVIVFAVVIGVLIAIVLIYKLCLRARRCCCNIDDCCR